MSNLKQSDGNTCPHCGSDAGYTVSDRANGWVMYEGFWNGYEEREDGEDGLHSTRSNAVKCIACGKRVERPATAERSPNRHR